MGSGRIYPVSDEQISVEGFPIPAHWPRIGAMDFGYSTFAGFVKLAWDREADCVYVTAAHKVKEETPAQHAATLRAWGKNLVWAFPHDGLANERGSGTTLASQYEDHGLDMLHERAQFEDGGAGVEPGIQRILERFSQGRLKIFSHLKPLFDEIHVYHRKDNKIVKREDHLLDALPYGIMMLRYATTPGQGKFGAGALKRGIRVV
jgi:hypothetical protein